VSATEEGAAVESLSQLAVRVGRLEDVEAIRNLFTEYGRLADAKDWAGYSELFVEGGTFGSPHSLGSVVGSHEMRERLESAYGVDPDGAFHLFDNIEIEVDGDRATAASMWTYLRPGQNGGAPELLMFGQYQDVLIRTDAGWRFESRISAM
jgi:hypothetical protein